MDKQIKTIYSQKLAGYLMYSGFVLINSRPDVQRTGRNIFFFNASDALEQKILEYKRITNS